MKFRIGEINAVDGAADRGALESLFLDGDLKLLHSQIGRLQGERGKGRETIGVRGAEFGELLVLDFDDLSCEVALAVVPEDVDRQDLHVDGLRIHRGEPLTEFDKGLLRTNVCTGLNPWPLLPQAR